MVLTFSGLHLAISEQSNAGAGIVHAAGLARGQVDLKHKQQQQQPQQHVDKVVTH
jgi:hypothetical protein